MFKRISVLLLGIILVLSVNACTGGVEYTLPNLSGLNSTDALALLADSPVTFNVETEESASVDDGLFVRYSDNLVSGDIVKEDESITLFFANNKITLPDLSGLTKSDIVTTLDNLGLTYSFMYESNDQLSEDTFLSYSEDHTSGDKVPNTTELVITISTQKIALPDLTGMDQLEIYLALQNSGIQYNTELITDNNVEDQTFSSYSDGYEIGDFVSAGTQLTVYIGLNSIVLPDLTGYVEKQIKLELESLDIEFTFEYVLNDNFAEDTFAGFLGLNAGDYYEEEVTVQLYKNTFTENETSLIISKYVDGGDDTNDQAIEIFNPTDSTVNLSDYYIAIYSNGSFEESYRIDLEDVDLAMGETYVIGNWYANGNLLVKADLSTKDLVFDGNDVIQLCYKNGTYIDTIGQLGDPTYIFDNEIFIRTSDVLSGTRNFNFYEWDGYIPTYYDLIGTHPVQSLTEPTFEFIARSFDNPLGGMDLVTLNSGIDGDTARFSPGFVTNSVRFIGVDTPETYYPAPEPLGDAAKQYTTSILQNAERIYIQSDPGVGFQETFGRYLGLIWCDMGEEGYTVNLLDENGNIVGTEHLTGWILLNYHIILNGYSLNRIGSEATTIIDHKYIIRWFQEAERYADENNLGVHA